MQKHVQMVIKKEMIKH